ncbi:hypothetical protein [Streptomyces sp. ISL-100]|uniref:hypothetical protein n=1 Tax=Streptomyces sp. ISL-100 TaxID=2819173 RepID=UPI001BE5B0AB|nr:hypothetical protein [Streptomyces sp. ISL-100]MBT2400774.1 hypothetical protein [Streptomyces sp. ISL-100]
MTQLAGRTKDATTPAELAAYKAVLDHAETCPKCPALRCPVGARLRQAEREARR